jgi:hypothetical protein
VSFSANDWVRGAVQTVFVTLDRAHFLILSVARIEILPIDELCMQVDHSKTGGLALLMRMRLIVRPHQASVCESASLTAPGQISRTWQVKLRAGRRAICRKAKVTWAW